MIAIVGAGITGLALAQELARRGADFVVLEAADVAGGVIRTLRTADGRVLEAGPQRTRLTRRLAALNRELGIEDELLLAPRDLPLFIDRNGTLRRVPFSTETLFRTDLFDAAEKLRILAEPLAGPARPDESVASFLTRRFGRAAYLHLLGPLFGGLYATDPADMLVRHALAPALRDLGLEHGSILLTLLKRRLRRGSAEGTPACSYRDGMRTLTDTLHERYAARVRLGTPVRTLRAAGGGYVLELDEEELPAEHVVLTGEAGAAAALLQPVAADAAARLRRLRYNDLALVHLEADCALPGLGYQSSIESTSPTRGVTFNASLFGESRARLCTAFVAGAHAARVLAGDDAAVGAQARADFRRATGCAAEVIGVARARMPAWDRSWTALDGLELPPGVVLAANYESRAGVAARLERARRLAERLAG